MWKDKLPLRPGTPEYFEYLKSWEWRILARKKWRRQNWRCADCEQKVGNRDDGDYLKPEMHHIRYDRCGAEWLSDIVGLCEYCHHTRHYGTSKMQQIEDELKRRLNEL